MQKLHYLFTILATFAITAEAENQTDCQSNEIYTDCGSCEATCDNQTPVCTKMCRPPGCYCPIGFVRDANSDCVPASTCLSGNLANPASNASVAVNPCAYTTCPVGTTCAAVQVQCFVAPCPPLAECRNETEIDLANTICTKANEKYTNCGGCELTCDNLNSICPAICHPPGCYCLPGFARDDNGECVDVSTCSRTIRTPVDLSYDTASAICKPNELYTTCGGCEPTCDNLIPLCIMCRPGCYCGLGFVRGANGDCVVSSTCLLSETSSVGRAPSTLY